ncbi:hypothetical protein PYV02_14765 [Leifsonia sp. H3M29-4]|uniref:hypothetical protein n=1 Tax=Salinibacterium metalliresistens TaxID=3031321 RepID=UPI0023DA62EB|nr:hypothetical protein [Salinibacterium metalliresistens]MDF1480345.1 hypothetical protein [Salinibacterium metalliresistens]
MQTNGAYVDPGSCVMWAPYYTHDPGPGGTSVSSIDQPWTYENMGTYIQFYLC